MCGLASWKMRATKVEINPRVTEDEKKSFSWSMLQFSARVCVSNTGCQRHNESRSTVLRYYYPVLEALNIAYQKLSVLWYGNNKILKRLPGTVLCYPVPVHGMSW
jgi:hypothetical protein